MELRPANANQQLEAQQAAVAEAEQRRMAEAGEGFARAEWGCLV